VSSRLGSEREVGRLLRARELKEGRRLSREVRSFSGCSSRGWKSKSRDWEGAERSPVYFEGREEGACSRDR